MKIVFLDIDDTLFNTEKLKNSNLTEFELYEEVEEALEALSKYATLGIFSQGEIAFQKNKLSKTKIEKYFTEKHTHIVPLKREVMSEIFRKYDKNIAKIFIDDWLENLYAAKKSDPSVFTIWMKRGRYADKQEKFTNFSPDATVENLKDAIILISQL